jgi:class 3 adenylate cyclase
MIFGYVPVLFFSEMADLQHNHRELEIESKKSKLKKATQQCEQLLLNILPKKVVLELQQLSSPKVFGQVSVLVSDIVGFTTMCSNTSANQVVGTLSDLFARFDDEIPVFSVEKVKTIGDSYIGTFFIFFLMFLS